MIASCGKTFQLQVANCWLELNKIYIETQKWYMHSYFLLILLNFVFISRGSGHKVFILCLCQFKAVGRLCNSLFNLHICVFLTEEPCFKSRVGSSPYP